VDGPVRGVQPTQLLTATMLLSVEMVRQLVEHGADKEKRSCTVNGDECTPAEWVRRVRPKNKGLRGAFGMLIPRKKRGDHWRTTTRRRAFRFSVA